MRSICLAICTLLSTSPVWSQTPPPKISSITPEQIKQAIQELSNPRFAVREKASKTLWEAGSKAESLLREAASSNDGETANRAKTILEKFDWGIYPDTPADVLGLIEKFRGGDQNVRQVVLGEMMRLKPTRFSTLRKLISRETIPEQREEMFSQLGFQARVAVPELIVSNQLDEAGELLEICLAQNNPTAMGDFASFVFLRKQVEPTIKRLEKQVITLKGADVVRVHETLAYLYRVQQKWDLAAKFATSADNKVLRSDIAWEANDWKTLIALDEQVKVQDDGDSRGRVAAYYRLAGDRKKFEETIAEIRKDLTGIEADDFSAREFAKSLLLNGEGAQAIQILKDRPGPASILVFDLLAAQLKYREAFAFADAAMKVLEKDPENLEFGIELNIRRAIILANLGDKDSALQLIRKIVQNPVLGDARQTSSSLVKDLIRAGHRDLALEVAEKFKSVAPNRRDDQQDFFEVFDLLYDERAIIAFIWFQASKQNQPEGQLGNQLKLVEKLIFGKATEKEIKLVEKNLLTLLAKKIPEKDDGTPTSRESIAYALGELYRISGDLTKADEAYKKSLNKSGKSDPAESKELHDDQFERVTPFILRGYADFLLSQKKHKEAAEIYQRAWKSDPSEPLPLFLRGIALTRAGDETRGKALVEAAHWVPLGNEHVRTKFADELSKLGFDEDSRREMQLVLDTGWFRTFDVGNVHLRMARILARKKEFTKAAFYYQKDVVSLFRTGASFQDPKAYLTVPELVKTFELRSMLVAGKVDEAIAQAKKSLDLLPGNVDLAIDLVRELDRLGKTKEANDIYQLARTGYQNAISDFPSSADLRNSIAWVMVNSNRDLADAKKHAEKAVSLKPDSAGYLDTLAEVYFKQKDRPKAMELMKKCAEMEPKNPYFRKQLERFEKKAFDSLPPDEETGDD